MRRVSPPTLESGRYVSDSDLYDFSGIDHKDGWDIPIVKVHLVCSWSVPDQLQGLPPNPTQLPPYTPNRASAVPFGAAGQPSPLNRMAVPESVMAPQGSAGQMSSMPSAYPQSVAPQIMVPSYPYPPSIPYGQVPMTLPPVGYHTYMSGRPYPHNWQNTVPPPQGVWPVMNMGGMPVAQSRVPTRGPPTDRPVAFHFRLFFEFATEQSIELHEQNMGMTHNRAIAVFREYPFTSNNVFDRNPVEVTRDRPFTMREVKSIVIDEKMRHRYRFVGGKGCAFWSLKVIHDLESAKLLEAGSEHASMQFYRRCAQQWRNPDDFAYEPVRGQFF